MDNSNKFFYETEIEYNPLKEGEEGKAKVLDQYMKICTSAVSSLLDLETIDDNSGLPDQFLVSREAIQNSIDAISEKNTLGKIGIKIRIRPVREDIEIYISDDGIGNNSKGSNLKKKNQDKYIGKHGIGENNLRQVLDRYKRVSSENGTRVVMRITNKDYLEKMLLRLSDEELKDLLS